MNTSSAAHIIRLPSVTVIAAELVDVAARREQHAAVGGGDGGIDVDVTARSTPRNCRWWR
jgi:hypothetical protein